MPLRSQDPILLHGQQLATQSTFGEETGAMFEEAVLSGPMGSLWRMSELDVAENGIDDNQTTYARTGRRTGSAPDSPLLSRDDALAQIKAAGLEGKLTVGEGGMRQRAVQILIDRKNAELRRQTILSQSPGGAGRMAARIGAGFAGSLVDPTNIALAFLPVVGEARYAALLSKATGMAGRTLIRAGVGAAEGVVGAALSEPLNYLANQQQQADYDAYDSALNIMGGAFFGSALHAGAGLFGDVVRPGRWVLPRAPEITERAAGTPLLEPTMRQVESPRAPEIDMAARERAIVLDRLAEGRPLTRDEAVLRAVDNLRADIEADLIAGASGVADKGVISAARTELSTVTKALNDLDRTQRERIREFNARPGVTRKQAEAEARQFDAEARADLLGRKSRAESIIEANKSGSDAVVALSSLRRGEIPEAWRPRVEAEADRLLGSDGQHPLSAAVTKAIADDPFRGIRPGLAALPADVQQGAMRMALAQMVTGRPVDVTPALFSHFGDMRAATDAAMRNAGEVAGADYYVADAATARLAEARADDLAGLTEAANDAETNLRDIARQAELSDDEISALMESAEVAVKEAKQQVSAFKIAALCALRAG